MPRRPDPVKIYFTVKEMARFCHTVPSRVYRWIRTGKHIPKACVKRLGKGKCAPIRFSVGPANSWLSIMYPGRRGA